MPVSKRVSPHSTHSPARPERQAHPGPIGNVQPSADFNAFRTVVSDVGGARPIEGPHIDPESLNLIARRHVPQLLDDTRERCG